MTDAINRFYNTVEGAGGLKQSTLLGIFVYYLTIEQGEDAVTPTQINECFLACELTPPTNTAARLSEGLKTKPPKFIKTADGYRLHRNLREVLSKKFGMETTTVQTSSVLRVLERKVPNGPAKEFLMETIDCFEVGANRATIVMAWILTMDHLYSHVLGHNLTAFNLVLANNKDKRVKVTAVTRRDDFGDIPESKFIEFCRVAKIISKDVRKILDQKLETRNSSAHPSGVKITKIKAIDFVEDLIENVVLKYKHNPWSV